MGAWAELRRRRVLWVAVAYGAAAWGLELLAGRLGPALGLPEWIVPFVLFLLVLGFPVVMTLAWAFEIEGGGLVRADPGPPLGARDKLGYLLLLAVGTALLVWLLASHWTHPRPPFAPHPHSVEAWQSD